MFNITDIKLDFLMNCKFYVLFFVIVNFIDEQCLLDFLKLYFKSSVVLAIIIFSCGTSNKYTFHSFSCVCDLYFI